MELSTYFNWDDTYEPELMSNHNSFFHELEPQYYSSDHQDSDNLLFNLPHTFFDYSYESHPHPLPLPLTSSSSSSSSSLSDHHHPLLPKRQKLCLQHHHHHGFFVDEAYEYNPYYASFFPALTMPDQFGDITRVAPPPPPPPLPPPLASGNINEEKKAVTAQSRAARQRRKKIAEKTEELGKLVPGGTKMNTAQMLLAASKYVKFLQAQLTMLNLINSLQEKKASSSSEDLEALLGCPMVEEKLYSEEMCFVPKDFVITLTNHQHLQTTPSLLDDLNHLINNKKLLDPNALNKMHAQPSDQYRPNDCT